MPETRPLTILAIASFFKGNQLLETAKKEGATVLLLTIEKLLSSPWCREHIDEVFALPKSFADRQELLNAVCYLARTRRIDRIVPMDDYDVEVAAFLREYLRLPGMGETTARYFRDKLAMREKAHDNGIRVPRFIHVLNHEQVRSFLQEVPGPWVLKPRSEAASVGIRKLHQATEIEPLLEELGDKQHGYLIEKMIPGDVYHVDALHYDGQIQFAACHKYRRPLLGIIQGGGLFGSRTVPHGSEVERELLSFHAQTLRTLGFIRGVTHTEFIRGAEDGQFYFLETGARVGGAHIADLVEASTGVNLWSEWARIELRAGKSPYQAPVARQDHAGLMISLARDEHPDTSAYQAPEIVWRLDMKHHVGFVFRSSSPERIEELFDEYEPRVQRDFQAVMPAPSAALD